MWRRRNLKFTERDPAEGRGGETCRGEQMAEKLAAMDVHGNSMHELRFEMDASEVVVAGFSPRSTPWKQTRAKARDYRDSRMNWSFYSINRVRMELPTRTQ